MKNKKARTITLVTLTLSLALPTSAKQPTPIRYPEATTQEGLFDQLSAARRTKALSKFKHLLMPALQYAQDNESDFPATQADLVTAAKKANIPNPETIDWPKKGDKLHYVPNLRITSKANSILLYSKPDKKGNRIVCQIDGSAKTLTKETFEKQAKAQNLTPPQ